jgi:hypothetical protein
VFRTSAPDINETWEWVEILVKEALTQVDRDIAFKARMTRQTAILNQKALVAALISGCYCPPPRMHILKTMIHPRFNEVIGCQDPDCRMGEKCGGNRLQLDTIPAPENPYDHDWHHHGYLTTDITNVVVHHKNDRR